jgi:ribosomal protein S18 acetylase RimI-like enzyme
MDLTIRKIEPNDLADVVSLLHEFAAFEDLSDYCEVTEERLHTAMFGADGVAEGLIALDNSLPIGYALFFPNFSSFRGQLGLYLDDIYINEKYRGKGVGEAMLREIARIAASRGFDRIDFQVLDWNTPAIGFYKKLGADSNDEETHFKFSDEAFHNLAS